ncbi:acyltransferase family protein [Pandoraea apista]|uniref:acyltransferase family protein n=1 Tax=Pandoraea apista TaxID=93218 RepID=UPI000659F261|nr:acyltransferase family protein [Pandoraea apista]ALS68373.1 hypothetical protein AT395_24820 [Pandoraea apista]ALS68435.1 hypothetical protein AT395_25170 [Pandoraea apista]CFB60463.1 O-acetyltransferase OatA [Pandoraea apista]
MTSNKNYRPDVDGLRALAVLLVVACHAGVSQLAGGFVGVDIFFVISGFVVTRSICSAQAAGNFRFRDFYVRRAKRLVPALFVMMAVTFAFSVVFLIPDDAMEVAKNMAYVAGFASNVYLAKMTGYFAPTAEQQPLLHTWSLSVEEQFYLVFPLVLFGLRHARARVKIASFIALGLASLAWSEMAVRAGAPGAYYFSQYRAFEFILGVVVAFLGQWNSARTARGLLAVLSLIGVLACATFIGGKPFPGVWALAPTVPAALLILSGHDSKVIRAVLGNRVALWIGLRSYGIYLWHWPILFAFRRFGLTSDVAIVCAVALSFVVAALSHRYVEQPLRYARVSFRRAVIGYILAPIALAASTVAVGRTSTNFLFMYPQQFREIYTASTDRDWMQGRGALCWGAVGVTSEAKCSVGAPGGRKAVLWGDSHAYHFVYFFRELGNEFGLSVHDMARPLCPPVADPPIGTRPNMDEPCREHDRLVMNYLLKSSDIEVVFLSGTWGAYVAPSNVKRNERGFGPEQIDEDLYRTAKALLDAGKQVVILDDVPPMPDGLINCPLYNGLRWSPFARSCEFSRQSAAGVEAANHEVVGNLAARLPAVKVMHTYGAACSNGMCATAAGNIPLYRSNDTTHLNLEGGAHYYQLYRRSRPGELEAIITGRP